MVEDVGEMIVDGDDEGGIEGLVEGDLDGVGVWVEFGVDYGEGGGGDEYGYDVGVDLVVYGLLMMSGQLNCDYLILNENCGIYDVGEDYVFGEFVGVEVMFNNWSCIVGGCIFDFLVMSVFFVDICDVI